jgi:hypothetical protein
MVSISPLVWSILSIEYIGLSQGYLSIIDLPDRIPVRELLTMCYNINAVV